MARSVFGINPVLELLRAKPGEVERVYVVEGTHPGKVAKVLDEAKAHGLGVEWVRRERLDVLAEGGVHQGVVAQVQEFRYADESEIVRQAKASGRPPLLLVLDGIEDPQNLGALIRSGHALGAHGVIIPSDRAAPVTGAAIKASAGAAEHTPVARVTNVSRCLEQLKEQGFWVVATDMEGDREVWQVDLSGPVAIVIGGEGKGIRPLVLSHCDFRVRIPMAGKVSSLNASAAGAILLYEALRQRAPGRAGKG